MLWTFSGDFFPSIWFYHLPQNMHRSFPTSDRIQIFLKLMVVLVSQIQSYILPEWSWLALPILLFRVLLLTIRMGIHTVHFRPSCFLPALWLWKKILGFEWHRLGQHWGSVAFWKILLNVSFEGVIILSLAFT